MSVFMRVMVVKEKNRLAGIVRDAAALLGATVPDGTVDGVFTVAAEDGKTVEVVFTYDPPNDCLNLCATVDAIEEADADACLALLRRNYLFVGTQGAAFAIAPDGAVVVQRDLAAADLAPDAFARAVRSLAGLAAGVERVDETESQATEIQEGGV